MATTFERICIKDHTIEDAGRHLLLKRGEKYLTSDVNKDGNVTVFSSYWAQVPVSIFAGEMKFT